MKKNTYINTRDKHTVTFVALRPYTGRDSTKVYALTNDSYQRLVTLTGFVVGSRESLIPPQGISRPATARQRVSETTFMLPSSAAQRSYEPTSPLIPFASTQERLHGRMQAQQILYGGTTISTRGAAANHSNFNHGPMHSSSLISGFPFSSNTRRPVTLPLHRPRDDDRRQREESRALLVILGVLSVSVATGFAGWKMWEYRAELLAILWHAIRWLAVKGFGVLKGSLRLIYRGLSWGAINGARLIKALAVMAWKWVSS